MALVSTYPTGVTVYDPTKCWNGYTLFQARACGALLIDMNGGEVHLWKDVLGFPNKMLPDGSILTNLGEQFLEGEQGQVRIAQIDWDGRVVWSYDQPRKSRKKTEPRYGWPNSTTTCNGKAIRSATIPPDSKQRVPEKRSCSRIRT